MSDLTAFLYAPRSSGRRLRVVVALTVARLALIVGGVAAMSSLWAWAVR